MPERPIFASLRKTEGVVPLRRAEVKSRISPTPARPYQAVRQLQKAPKMYTVAELGV